jgi:hypothetical protein
LYTASSIAASLALYVAVAAITSPVPRDVRVGFATVVLVLSLAVHAAGMSFTWFAQQGRQSVRSLANAGRLGRLYFGAVLGVGIATHMTTPLVWASLFVASVEGVWWAAAAGIGFGLARALPALAGGVFGGDRWLPGAVTRLILSFDTSARIAGVAIAVGSLVVVWH